MRASIPNAECGFPEHPHAFWLQLRCDRKSKRPHRKNSYAASHVRTRSYCLLDLLGSDFGSDFGSGLFAAGCLDAPCPPACACETSNIRVPLSRCTFFPAEVITEPCVE